MDSRAARHARQFARETLTAWGVGGSEDTVALLVSELVTNAVLHARTQVEVRLEGDGRLLRIEVRDRNTRRPVRERVPVDATTGRGLALVEAVADRWGVQPHADGKVVWCELTLDRATREPSTS